MEPAGNSPLWLTDASGLCQTARVNEADDSIGTVAEQMWRAWHADPEEFWRSAAAAIDWVDEPSVILDDANAPLYRWFPNARLNVCANALDRHVAAGRGERTAIIYDSPVTGQIRHISYQALLDDVAAFAGALAARGITRGDRVIIYLPMVPEAIVAMLACARLGAVHSVVFGGFAAAELAARIDDARPKAVLTASCGIEPARIIAYGPLLHDALDLARHRPEFTVVLQRPQQSRPLRDDEVAWDDFVEGAEPADPVPVLATDPLYLLYTSGSTGRPKGVVRDSGGYAVAMAWSFANVFGMSPDDVWWSASDVGWVVGHSYIVYAPLITGSTTIMYEGKPIGTPDAGAFWRVIAEHGVAGLFTAPTAIRAIKKEDPAASLLAQRDVTSLRALFLAGERLDPATFEWAREHLKIPVVDNWWQTETGWPIVATMQGVESPPILPGSPGVPVPGYDVRILNEQGATLPAGEEGAIAIRLPLPPGTLPTLWGDDERYIEAYLSTFPGYYASGDGGFIDQAGYVFVMGRTDDVINVAGHRLSTGSIEAVVAAHPAVAECAVIGVHDPLKGQVPRAFVVLKSGAQISPDELEREVVTSVRETIGPVAVLKQVVVVPGLPKTRSGKILRKTMRGIADGREEPIPSTIEDVAVLERIRPLLIDEAAGA